MHALLSAKSLQHEHCKQCAEACRRYAEECRAMG
ncbi:four-helix bundle copper-binding protein [Paraburkholderia sp. 2C]